MKAILWIICDPKLDKAFEARKFHALISTRGERCKNKYNKIGPLQGIGGRSTEDRRAEIVASKYIIIL